MAADDFLTWCDELHQVKGNILQFQATLNQVLSKAPSVAKYREMVQLFDDMDKTGLASAAATPQLMDRLRVLVHLPQVRVAVRLKQLYESGYLPFMAALAKINFKLQRLDRFVNALLDYQPSGKPSPELLPDEPKKKHIELDSNFPPCLPPLDNKLLMKLVLTDKLVRQPMDFLEDLAGENDFNNNHNRKLAALGKKYLDLALFEVLDLKFPGAHEDDLAYLLQRLTLRHMLAKLAYCYNFPEHVSHVVSAEMALDDKLIVFQNVFLAYIGALVKAQYPFADIKLWIGKLYDPLVLKLHSDCQDANSLKNAHAVAYAELQFLMARVANAFASQPTKKLRYDFSVVEHDPYVCVLEIGGTYYGTGTGSTELEAKQKAAYRTFVVPEIKRRLLNHLLENFRKVDEEKPESDDEEYDPERLDKSDVPVPSSASSQPPLSSQLSQPPQPPGAPIEVQQRKPLPYGALPAIPGAKKRGGAGRI